MSGVVLDLNPKRVLNRKQGEDMRKIFWSMLIPVAMCATLHAQAAQEGLITRTVKILSLKVELEAAQAALDACAAKNSHAHVFIVDAEGNTKLLLVGDGSRANTVESARQKAFTSAIMGRSTASLKKMITENPGMQLPPDPRMLFVGGGVPIRAGSEVIGAIGVGGGSPEQDDLCAQAGVDKIQHYLQ